MRSGKSPPRVGNPDEKEEKDDENSRRLPYVRNPPAEDCDMVRDQVYVPSEKEPSGGWKIPMTKVRGNRKEISRT